MKLRYFALCINAPRASLYMGNTLLIISADFPQSECYILNDPDQLIHEKKQVHYLLASVLKLDLCITAWQ